MASTPYFAVIDLETTGLDPACSRIVECAVLEVSPSGTIQDEWSSLIGIPGEDEPGAQELHGITKAMLKGAPAFLDVSAEIVSRLRNHIVVGHVLEFDLNHLRTEFARSGYELPELDDAGICTRDLARIHLQGPSYALSACCERAGVSVYGAHTALGDARATAKLLMVLLERSATIEGQDPSTDAAQQGRESPRLDVDTLWHFAQRLTWPELTMKSELPVLPR